MFSCFFVFGKKVSANENQNAAPIITYYGLNGNAKINEKCILWFLIFYFSLQVSIQ